MHRNVALSMRGIMSSYKQDNVDEGVSVLSPAEDASEAALLSFIDNSLWVSNDDQGIASQSTQKLAIVPVPTSFYELLRSVHGVYCNDGDVSYAPPLPIVNDAHHGGSRTTSGSSGSKHNGLHHEMVGKGGATQQVDRDGNATLSSTTSSLLFHDQWKICDDGAKDKENNQSTSNLHPDTQHDMYQGYHPLYFSNNPQTTSPTSQQLQPQALFRPIEFRRQVLPVSLPEIDGDHKEDATLKERSDTNERNDSIVAGYAVEYFPVELFYTIVDGDAELYSSKSTVSTSGKNKQGAKNVKFKIDSDRRGINSYQGIALASRSSSAFAVLRDLQQAAAPNRAQACVRLWKKSVCRSATVKGDGYDVLDVTSLCAAPSPATQSPGKSNGRQQPELTVEQWLGLEPLSVRRGSEQEKPMRVELLVEIRKSLSSTWVREPLELSNRLQVRKTTMKQLLRIEL